MESDAKRLAPSCRDGFQGQEAGGTAHSPSAPHGGADPGGRAGCALRGPRFHRSGPGRPPRPLREGGGRRGPAGAPLPAEPGLRGPEPAAAAGGRRTEAEARGPVAGWPGAGAGCQPPDAGGTARGRGPLLGLTGLPATLSTSPRQGALRLAGTSGRPHLTRHTSDLGPWVPWPGFSPGHRACVAGDTTPALPGTGPFPRVGSGAAWVPFTLGCGAHTGLRSCGVPRARGPIGPSSPCPWRPCTPVSSRQTELVERSGLAVPARLRVNCGGPRTPAEDPPFLQTVAAAGGALGQQGPDRRWGLWWCPPSTLT